MDSDKQQYRKMRWILFWVFVILFCAIVVATILSVFAGIGSPTDAERDKLLDVFFVEIGAAVVALFYSIFKLRKPQTKQEDRTSGEIPEEYPVSSGELLQQIQDAGLTAFYQSRNDYARYRKEGATIDAYVASAEESILMISVNLVTGLEFDGLCALLERKLEDREKDISVTISLLNPWKDELMETIAPVLSAEPGSLSESIKRALAQLYKLRHRISQRGKQRLAIRVHNSIPFGSAIILDDSTKSGRIQIETKPYKAPMRRSFAFEVTNHEGNVFYKNLVDGYKLLVKDGCSYEDLVDTAEIIKED